ncbi:MAG: hypothetical protein JWR69_2786, partial [Pedosphaera sp.]|nr:hypothetical protein [Pedosphaera sp.]
IGTTKMQGIAGNSTYRAYAKESDLTAPGAARTWMMIDEHEKSINDAWFFVDMSGARAFADLVATRHNRGYVLSFCDGHSEIYKLRDGRTDWPIDPNTINTPANPDFAKLRDVTSALQ